MGSGASLSPCRHYRYFLWRSWLDMYCEKGTVLFIMLNPSTADAERDDPTIRRCIGFAKTWGYSRLEVVNLHPLRTSDPKDLNRYREEWQTPEDNTNERIIQERMAEADLVVAAWGALKWSWLDGRGERVECMAEEELVDLHVLGLTKHGYPRHPLYVSKDITPVRWHP